MSRRAVACVFAAAVAYSLSHAPAASAAGMVVLCGPDYGYGCVAGTGYTGQSTWGSDYGNGHNCVSYVAFRLAARGAAKPWGPRIGNAYEWDNFARAAGVPVNGVAVSGAVAQWEGRTTYAPGAFGHVAHVDSVTASYIDISEDTFSLGYMRRVRIYRGSPYWPSNFIHVYDLGSTAVGARFVGDWDGNGTTTIGVVYRTPSGLQWHLRNSNSSGAASTIFNYGNATDTPIVGNWDGTGGDTIGIARPTANGLQWHLRNYNSAGPAGTIFNYGNGNGTDGPIVGNWDGVRGDTVGVVRRVSAMQWHLRNYNSAGPAGLIFFYGSALKSVG